MKSVMSHSFATIPAVNLPRSTFNRSRGYKGTFDSGYIVPFFIDEVIPGDTYNVRANILARLSTPIKPVMDNMYLETFFFFVPNRLLWNNWEKFCGAQDNPGDSTSFTIPVVPIASGGAPAGTLHNYLGVPAGTQITTGFNVNALPSRAYNLIYNQWFRDENMQNSVTVDKGDGPDTLANYVIKRRGKRHDYFTSCLPWPQKGTAVSLPVGAYSAPVSLVPYTTSTNSMLVRNAATDALDSGANALYGHAAGGGADGKLSSVAITGETIDPNGRLVADLTSAFATTINQLRLAEQTQVLLERDARGGTRYVEICKSHFGVINPDQRAQRPEYLGGGSSPINIHPVAMTAASSGGTSGGQQGNLAAFGTGSARNHGFNKSFVEHGYILGFVNVRADLTYQSGLDKLWSRSTRYDFYWPSLANIGEQSVLNGEIYKQGTATDANVFGYIPRYDEYRFGKSLITGKFNSHYATTLDVWHLSQKFTALPTLGDTFISDTPPVDRVVAVPSEPQFLFDAYINCICARVMPVHGVPGLGTRL